MFDEIKSLIFSKTAKDTSIVFAGNAASFAFGIVFTILAARQINPEGWGVFSAVVAFVGILLSIGDFGLTSGLFRFVSNLWSSGEKTKAQGFVSAIFTLRLITAVLLSALVILFSGWIARDVFKTDAAALSVIAAMGLFIFLLNDFQISVFQAKLRWKIASVFSFLNNLTRLALILILPSFMKLDLISVSAIFFASPALTLLLSFVFERPGLIFKGGVKSMFAEISKFSFWMGINRTAGAVSSRVDSLILLQLSTPAVAGIVGIARQLSNAVLILLASFATVIAPRFSSYKGSNLRKYFNKTILLSVLLSIGIVLGTFFVDPIISLLGPKYADSSGVLKTLMITLVPFALSGPSVNALIYSFHKPKIIAILSIVQLPLIIIGNIYAIPVWGVFGPVVVLGFWNLSTLLVSHIYVVKYFNSEK